MDSRTLRRVGALLTAGYLLIAVALGYWQVAAAGSLDQHPNNPRPVLEYVLAQRGAVLDRQGNRLAWSEDGSEVPVRRYADAVFAPVTGYYSTRHGLGGIELTYDSYLSGDGGTALENAWRGLLGRPRVGANVSLTIDSELQKAAAAELKGATGAIVMLDPRNGDVLALASAPGYNPATIDAEWDRLTADPATPLVNRASSGLYPPGSTFKTVTAAAALEDGVATLDTKFEYRLSPPDRTHPIAWHSNPFTICENHGNHPTLDFRGAYGYSCNVAFSEMALDLGAEKLLSRARAFGFESAIPFDIPTATSQISHTPNYFTGDERFYALAATGFGQGELSATPLQMALVAAAVANNGEIPKPRLVTEVRALDGSVVYSSEPAVWRRAMTAETAAKVKVAMEFAVDGGWASQAAIKGVKVAGKTGTAETGREEGEPHSWFIGFAPADAPRVVVAILKESAGQGSIEAAPVAKTLMEKALARPTP